MIALALTLSSCGRQSDEQRWVITRLNGSLQLVDGYCFYVESVAVGIRVVCQDAQGEKIFDGVVASYEPVKKEK